MMPAWLDRPGLAGGIDKDGRRAAELLGCGFGSVEFGSVTAQPLPGQNGGIVALATTLGALSPATGRSAIGIGLGLPPEVEAERIPHEWAAGFGVAALVADYISLNLSARANRRFLDPVHRPMLAAAFAGVSHLRDAIRAGGRDVWLAVKLPVNHAETCDVAKVALNGGIDQLTVVLPDEGPRWERFSELVESLGGQGCLVAVGGIRNAAEAAAARASGALGVQVHRLFVEQGAQCLRTLSAMV